MIYCVGHVEWLLAAVGSPLEQLVQSIFDNMNQMVELVFDELVLSQETVLVIVHSGDDNIADMLLKRQDFNNILEDSVQRERTNIKKIYI